MFFSFYGKRKLLDKDVFLVMKIRKSSWQRPLNDKDYIGRKQIDLSIFKYGSQIPLDFIPYFDEANKSHLERGNTQAATLILQNKPFDCKLSNIKVKKRNTVVYQIRYDSNKELINLLTSIFSNSNDYINSVKKDKDPEDRSYIVVPENQAEYLDFYKTETPFSYRLEVITSNYQSEKPQLLISDDVLIVAFYLSKFDKIALEKLGFSSFSEAFRSISSSLNIKYNTLKNTRDRFDAHTESPRQGYKTDLSKKEKSFFDKYNGYSESELRKIVEDIIVKEHSNEQEDVIFSEEDFIEMTGVEISTLQKWLKVIERKKQIVFYGSPGTGKTFIAQHLAKLIVSESDGIIETVQFHPAFSYEDFIQGIRPVTSENGDIEYPTVKGRFITFCEQARSRNGTSVMIIDEINRSDLSRVFGELMYLLEYRDQEITLASGSKFSIPSNLVLIGTMNTADRSIALVDHALRRRFAFIALRPDYVMLERYHKKMGNDISGITAILKKLNRQIDDVNYEVGISFFMKENLFDHLPEIWQMEIEPYLEEFFFDQQSKINEFRWDNIAANIGAECQRKNI